VSLEYAYQRISSTTPFVIFNSAPPFRWIPGLKYNLSPTVIFNQVIFIQGALHKGFKLVVYAIAVRRECIREKERVLTLFILHFNGIPAFATIGIGHLHPVPTRHGHNDGGAGGTWRARCHPYSRHRFEKGLRHAASASDTHLRRHCRH
jgi:hypothetical protein